MDSWFCLIVSRFATMTKRLTPRKCAIAAVTGLLPYLCEMAPAQTPAMTTISGTVYDARTANALPLSNVLVYATTDPVPPLPSGVQCLTYQAPTNVVSYAYSAVDGTFTLGNIPQNGNYTLVIQAGKWRRQFPNQTVGTDPVTSLALHMPADHTQGDIPMIAIVTGSVDGVECILRDMGISDTEFTDDNQTVNPGGHIHLYEGAGNSGKAGGAIINTSTPSETTLTGGTGTELNNYDMVMFPCQGGQFPQTTSPLTNLVNYANAGGRIFTTHYSYVYLDPNSPMYAQFAPVANWTTTGEKQINTGVGTVATDFSDGATLAQWLQNSGATVTGTSNQINISTLRTDVGTVIPPTQSWLTLNSGTYSGQTGNPVMQMTFNTPVGAPAASQCGRVMFNDYHVFNVSDNGVAFPNECPDPATHVMSAQEKMLEYALFDLSTFVQPVVVPTLSVGFNPSPLIVKSGDTGDQVTATVTNTSTTTQIDSSAILTFALPPQVTVTAMTDSTGGWSCTVGTLTCTRNSSLGANFSDSVTLTLNVGTYTTLASYTGQLTATISSVTFSTNVTASDKVVYQQVPQITWTTPAPIIYGTPLSGTQLDASSTVAGTFTYTPAAGTILNVGQQTLQVSFAPTDTTDYTTATASVTVNVVPATPVVTLTSSANPAFFSNAVSFTASLPSYASTQTGTMTFFDGAMQIGTANVSGGSGTLTTTALAAGVHTITAAYSGDSNYGPGTSSPVAETIEDFTLAFANGSGSTTATAGGQASYTLVVTPVGGTTLPAAIALTTAQAPLGSSAAFTPATIAAGSGATTVTLQLKLPSNAALERPHSPFGGGALPVALGLILLPFASRLRKGRARLTKLVVLAAIGAGLTLGFSGCGSPSFSAQDFSFTVTATSGSLSHSVSAQLTVK
jgi:Bacterial Ig-like domain (group 3)